MKKIVLLICSDIISLASLAQKSAEVNITGIDSKIERNILPGDVISYWTGDDGTPYQNIRVRVTTEDGNEVFHTALDATPDDNGHYTINHKVLITESSRIKLEGELELLIYVETIFGNYIWTEINRNMSNISEPIVLDKYSKQQGRSTPAQKAIKLEYYFIAEDKALKEKVLAHDDNWEDRKISDFRFMLKNVGDKDWKINEVFETGQNVMRRSVKVSIPFDDVCPIDLSKKIVLRVEMQTTKGNLLWEEAELDARGLKKTYYSKYYDIVESGKVDETGSVVNEDLNSNGNAFNGDNTEKIDQNNQNNNILNSEKPEIDDEIKSNQIIKEEISVKPGQIGAIDLTTRTDIAVCDKMEQGDTLINVNGSKVCVKAFRPQGAKAMVGTLAMDCNFEIKGTVFPIQGNKTIICNKADGKLVEGVLRENTVYSSSVGKIVLKKGSVVKFLGDQLIGGTLAENATLTIDGKTIKCAVNPKLEQDIRFDVQGRLVDCTLSEKLDWNAKVALYFPEMSRLVFKNGSLHKVYCASNSSFELNGKTLTVKGDNNETSYEFSSDNELTEITSGEANQVEIEKSLVDIQEGTTVSFEVSNNLLAISKFYVAKDININVYKGSSAKSVDVKMGKKVVLKDGVVIKAG